MEWMEQTQGERKWKKKSLNEKKSKMKDNINKLRECFINFEWNKYKIMRKQIYSYSFLFLYTISTWIVEELSQSAL